MPTETTDTTPDTTPRPYTTMRERCQTTGRVTKLRVRIMETGLPQYKIAAKAGIHPSRVSEYASGTRMLGSKHLAMLCAALDKKPGDILGYYEV